MGIMFAFLTALSFATSNIFIRKGINYNKGKNNGFVITVIINVLLLSIFLAVYLIITKYIIQFSWSSILFFILAGLLTTGLGRLTFFSSINLINPSRAAGIKNVAPLFTVLFALFILGESFNFQISIGIIMLLSALVIQGVLFFLKAKNETKHTSMFDNKEWIGYLLAVIAAIMFGVGQGTRKQALLLTNEPYLGAWIGAITALIFVMIQLLIRKKLKATVKENIKYLNKYFIFAGILTSIGPLSFFLASSMIPVSIVSVIAAIEPLFTILLSTIFLKGKGKEDLTISIWIVALLVFIGSIIIINGI